MKTKFLLKLGEGSDGPFITGALKDISAKRDEFFSHHVKSVINEGAQSALDFKLTSTKALPWLHFDPKSMKISGTPNETGDFTLKLSATDFKNMSASTTLHLHVDSTGASARTAPWVTGLRLGLLIHLPSSQHVCTYLSI